jgi:hypothetical protein
MHYILSLLAVFLPLILCGCSSRAGTEPIPKGVEIAVFNDGFHSGFLIPREFFALEVHSRFTQASKSFVEVGFSDWQWVTGQDRSPSHVSRLLFVPGEGALIIKLKEAPDITSLQDSRSFAFSITVDQETLEKINAEIIRWLDLRRPGVAAKQDPGAHYFHTTPPYLLSRNCHDFTAKILQSAGWPIRFPFFRFRLPEQFTQDLKNTAMALQLAGWQVRILKSPENPAP